MPAKTLSHSSRGVSRAFAFPLFLTAALAAPAAPAATLSGNRVTRFADGFFLDARTGFTLTVTARSNTVVQNLATGFSLANAQPGTYAVTLARNRVFGNPSGGVANPTPSVVDAAQNWWGCNAGPGGSGTGGPCDTVSANVTTSPRLVLSASVAPTSLPVGGSATLTADLTRDDTNVVTLGVPDGTPVTFTTSLPGSSVAPPSGTTASGLAATSLTSGVPGTTTACAVVDNETSCAPTPVGFVAAAIPALSGLGNAVLGLVLAAAAVVALRFVR